jgi:hypothetical protein
MPRGSNFQRPYPPQFRREAVELYRRAGRPVGALIRSSYKSIGFGTRLSLCTPRASTDRAGINWPGALKRRRKSRKVRRTGSAPYADPVRAVASSLPEVLSGQVFADGRDERDAIALVLELRVGSAEAFPRVVLAHALVHRVNPDERCARAKRRG